jgi:hypothetical protein
MIQQKARQIRFIGQGRIGLSCNSPETIATTKQLLIEISCKKQTKIYPICSDHWSLIYVRTSCVFPQSHETLLSDLLYMNIIRMFKRQH